MYPSKAYLETIASFGTDAKNGHLRCSYFAMDKPARYDTPSCKHLPPQRFSALARTEDNSRISRFARMYTCTYTFCMFIH